MKQFNREGKVTFHDASLHVWEEGLGGSNKERDAWEEAFMVEVFKPMVWFLRKLGWTTEIDADDFADTKARHGLKFAQKWSRRKRLCSHGDLKGEISVSGRCIEFKMWQGVNTPTRSDHGGKYESDKEEVMPYLLRLRMERTRRKLRDYLLHRCTGYTFEDKSPSASRVGPNGKTAYEYVQEANRKSGHFKEHLGRAEISMSCDETSADKLRIVHGEKVYAKGRKGRILRGTAYFKLGQWWIVTGKYDYEVVSSFEIYVNNPGDLRVKRNERSRRGRLESELAKAIKAMNFKRAEVIKNILFPACEDLYLLRHPEGKYHCSNFCGYTRNVIDAGKFTLQEIRSCYPEDSDNKAVPLKEAS